MKPEAVRLAVIAMATRFELVLPIVGKSVSSLRAAGEMALSEIQAAENLLSMYRPNSPIAQANQRASVEPVKVPPPVFALLERTREVSKRTGGAFDPTIGSLVRAWRELDPAEPEWSRRMQVAKAARGWDLVVLDASRYEVRFLRPGLRLDLGSVGKGWALDRSVEVLREAGVECALLHGGTSTVVALGSPPDGSNGWRIQIDTRGGDLSEAPGRSETPPRDDSNAAKAPEFLMLDSALSVSATWGRTHRNPDGSLVGHLLDPRTGEAIQGARCGVVWGREAAMTDMLSTALLVRGAEYLSELEEFGPGIGGWWQGENGESGSN